MNQKLFLMVFFLLVSKIGLAQNGSKNFIDQNYIEITGKAEMEIVPNEIYLSIVLHEDDAKNKNVEQMEQELIAKLTALGIKTDEALKALGFNGSFNKYFLKKNEVVKSKSYQLKVSEGLMVSKVFSALDDMNISRFGVSHVSHSDFDKLLRKVKINALKAAKEKAVQYAQAIGQDIGKALYIEEQSNY